MNQATKGKINLVGCGGTGLNIVSKFESMSENSFPGLADIATHYVDTSVSNLGLNIPAEKFHQIDGTEGSGAIRKENAADIRDTAPSLAQKLTGDDLVILVGSASGGSGSVIMPLLSAALLDKDQQFIVFLVGSSETIVYANNTVNTIASFAGIVDAKGKPITLFYMRNSPTLRRASVDQFMGNAISALCALFSRENKEMDPQDLRNWLRFERATSNAAQLSVLTLVGNASEPEVQGNLLSLATLTDVDLDTTFGGHSVEYQTIGYFQADDIEMRSKLPIHFAISDGILHEEVAEISAVVKKFNDEKDSAKKKKPLLTSASRDSDGMVF